jgi:hypothetical protein
MNPSLLQKNEFHDLIKNASYDAVALVPTASVRFASPRREFVLLTSFVW